MLLTMSFWQASANDDGLNNQVIFTPANSPRNMKLLLIYLRGEQEKIWGITKSRGEQWRNSWSASIRSLTRSLFGGESYMPRSTVLEKIFQAASNSSYMTLVRKRLLKRQLEPIGPMKELFRY